MVFKEEKQVLINEALSRSRVVVDRVHYGLYTPDNGFLARITTDVAEVEKLLKCGYKLYVKAKNGNLTL